MITGLSDDGHSALDMDTTYILFCSVRCVTGFTGMFALRSCMYVCMYVYGRQDFYRPKSESLISEEEPLSIYRSSRVMCTCV